MHEVNGQDGVGVRYCGDELVWIVVMAVVVVGDMEHVAATGTGAVVCVGIAEGIVVKKWAWWGASEVRKNVSRLVKVEQVFWVSMIGLRAVTV